MTTRGGDRGLQDLLNIVEFLGRARRRGLFGSAYDDFMARNGVRRPWPASPDVTRMAPGGRRGAAPRRVTDAAYPTSALAGTSGNSSLGSGRSIPLASPLDAFGVSGSPLAPRIKLPPNLAPSPAKPAWVDPRALGAAPDRVDPSAHIPLDAFGPMPAGAKTQAPAPMRTSAQGIAFIKSFERGPDGDVAATQYRSPERGSDTIGWGHKIQRGEEFSKGLTREQAEQLFLSDVRDHEALVRRHLRVPVTQQQFDALVALSFGTPREAITNSTLMRRLNSGDVQGAGDQILVWDKVGKTPMRGLTLRRQAEREIFLNGVYNNH